MLENRFIKPIWEAHIPLTSKQITLSILMGIFCYVVIYATNIVLARVLGAQVYGEFTATTSALIMLASFVLIGADVGLGRFIPKYLKDKDYEGFSGYIRYSGKWVSLLDLGVFIFGLLAMAFLYHLTGEHVLNIKHTYPVYFFIWGVPLITFLVYIGKFIRASGYSSFSLFLMNALLPIFMLIMLGIFLIFIRKFTIAQALLIYFSATLGTVFVGFVFAHFKTELPKVRTKAPRYEPDNWRGVVRDLFFLNIATFFMNTILLIVITIFDKELKMTGFVAAVITICNLLWIVNSSIYSALTPRITVAGVEKDKKEIKAVLFHGILSNLIIGGAIFAIMVIWGQEWLLHFGQEFVQAYPLLLIIGGSFLISVIGSPLGWIFQQSTQLKAYTKFSLVCMLLYIVFCSLATYCFGGVAGALVYAVVQIISVAYLIGLTINNWHNPDFIKPAGA